MRVFVSSGRLPAAPTGLGARRLPWGLRRAPARIHAGLDTMRVPGPCPGLGAGTPRATADSCGSTSLRGRVARSGDGGGVGGERPGCRSRVLGPGRAAGHRGPGPPSTHGLVPAFPPRPPRRSTRRPKPRFLARLGRSPRPAPRPSPRPAPAPPPAPPHAPRPAPAPPRAPPPARPGGGRSAGAERAHRGGGRSIRGADGPARRAWRRGAGRRGGAAGGRSGVSRAGGRAGGGRLCALTCSALSTGGPGCGRCGGASWTCWRPSSCCLGSALPRRSQVTPAGTRDPAPGRPPPALCAGPPRRVPAAAASSPPAHLGLGPGGGPGATHARRRPAGAGRSGEEVGPVSPIPSVPRWPFILRPRGFAPPRRAAGFGGCAGLGGALRAARAVGPTRGDQTSAALLESGCARLLRAAGRAGARERPGLWARWGLRVPPAQRLRRRRRPRRPPARPVSRSPASSVPAPERPQGVAPRGPRSDRAPGPPGPRGRRRRAAQSRLASDLLRQSCPGSPGPAFVRRRAAGPLSSRSPRCRVARAPLMRPRENNAPKSVVWLHPLRFPRARELCGGALPVSPASGTPFLTRS